MIEPMTTAAFLVPEQAIEKNGEGPAIEVEPGALLEVTLGILEVREQQSIDVGIHGSPDGTTWTPKPIAAFPQKFYPGSSKIFVDLSRFPEMRYVRAQWKVNRWGNWLGQPARFVCFVAAEPAR